MESEVGRSTLSADLLLHSTEGLHMRRLAVGAVVKKRNLAVGVEGEVEAREEAEPT